jgi:hypothetical protein
MENVEFREQQTKDCAGCEYALADLAGSVFGEERSRPMHVLRMDPE